MTVIRKALAALRRNVDWVWLASLAVSILLGLGVGALLMAAMGVDPFEGYRTMVEGAFGSKWAPGEILRNKELGTTLYRTSLLMITGLATAVASDAGLFNVGGQGQMCLGALAAAWLGAQLTTLLPFTAAWPVWAVVIVCLLASALAGLLYALIPALMKVKLNISEVVTTILMNSVAVAFCSFMITGPLKDPVGKGSQTEMIPSDFFFTRYFKPSNLSEAVFFVAGISLLVWYLMSRTTGGYEMRMAGQNPRFAKFSGLKAGKLSIAGMLISGAMCGIVGMLEVFGWHHRYSASLSTDFYWDGMLVAMIMRYKPLGIILMSFFFGIMKSGVTRLQAANVSSELIQIIQSVIIFFMAAEQGLILRFRTWHARRHPHTEEEVAKA